MLRPTVKIAALSDFHIGARAHTDGFRHDLAEFGRTLDRLEAQHDRIVLLGDIFQTDHSAMPTRRGARRMLRQARDRVAPLRERFDRAPYVYVWGNHDEIAESELGAAAWLRYDGRVPVVLTHGHQFDPVAVRAPWAANLGTWGTGRLRALGLRPLAWWLEQRDVSIKDARFRGDEGPYAHGARRLLAEHDASIAVMGHTHVPGITALGTGAMVNTGTCSGGRTMWASIDTEQGTIEVHDGAEVTRHRVVPTY